ncbi:hypothetical protein ES703_53408 [subsurface metagenome]
MKIYFGVGNSGRVKSLVDPGTNPVNIHAGYFNRSEAVGESLQMFFKRKDFAVIASHHFVNPIAKVGSTVKINRFELFGRQNFVLYHGYLHKITPEEAVGQDFNFIFGNRTQKYLIICFTKKVACVE